MANRNTLSVKRIDEFKVWLEKDGWEIKKPKGCYEVLRAVKQGRKHPLIVYLRLDTNNGNDLLHFTILDRDMGVVRAFLAKLKEVKE
jgi:hypothetical protein